MVAFNATIRAERGVTPKQIEAASLGLKATLLQTGLQHNIQAVHETALFPTLPSGQVSSEVVAGHPIWQDGGLNLWLTARDLNHYTGSTNFIYGISGSDGHLAVSTHRLDTHDRDNPYNLLTTVAHESGHALGLVDEQAIRHSTKYGFSGHCMNDCTMEASNGMTDTERATQRLLANLGTAGFCVECLGDLRRFGRMVS